MFLRVSWTRYNLFPKNLLGCTRVTALNVRVPSSAPTVGAKMPFKNTWLKSPKKQLSLNIMTTISNDSVSQCLLHCLKQTKWKYGAALLHSSGLSKHGTSIMWKITKMRKICPFCFSQKFFSKPFIHSLHENVTAGFWFILNLILWDCDASACHSTGFKFPTPQIQEYKNLCLNPQWHALIVTNLHNSTVFLI